MDKDVNSKKSNFSIWDSVVNEKILLIEELEEKSRKHRSKIEELEAENAILKEQLANLYKESDETKAKSAAYEEQVNALLLEKANLSKAIADMETSTCWKITSPIRVVLNKFRPMS